MGIYGWCFWLLYSFKCVIPHIFMSICMHDSLLNGFNKKNVCLCVFMYGWCLYACIGICCLHFRGIFQRHLLFICVMVEREKKNWRWMDVSCIYFLDTNKLITNHCVWGMIQVLHWNESKESHIKLIHLNFVWINLQLMKRYKDCVHMDLLHFMPLFDGDVVLG